MKKSDFVAEVAKKTGLSQAKSNDFLTAVLDVITDTLKAGDKVTLTGFGSFEVRDRAARVVTDIRTKEKKQTPASKYPAFSSGAVLKAAVKPAASKPAQPASKAKSTSSKSAKPAAKSAPAKAASQPASKSAGKAATKGK